MTEPSAKLNPNKSPKAAMLLVHWVGSKPMWRSLDRSGAVLAQGQVDPEALERLPAAESCRVLVSARSFTPMVLDLPVMSKQRLNQAVVWAAEEFVAGPIEHEHVVACERDPSGKLQALAVARSVMDQWVDAVGPLSPDAMMPDAMCLPWRPGVVSLAASDEGILMRWGEWSFGVFGLQAALLMLDQWTDVRFDWWGQTPPPDVLGERVVPASNGTTQETLLDVLTEHALESKVNVLTGPWKTKRAVMAQSHWRWVAGLGLGVVLLAMASVGVEQVLLTQQAKALQQQVQQRYSALFPHQPAMGRERELIAREMAKLQLGQAAGLLDVLLRVQPVLAANDSARVNTLNYEAGQLVLAVVADDVATLDQIARQLKDLSLQASVQSATLSADGAQGRVVISMGDV